MIPSIAFLAGVWINPPNPHVDQIAFCLSNRTVHITERATMLLRASPRGKAFTAISGRLSQVGKRYVTNSVWLHQAAGMTFKAP
jgi:hypothetical protein